MGTKAEGGEFLNKMVTQSRAEVVARALFPGEFHQGDCKKEVGREGEPCRICAEKNALWAARVFEVREAVKRAFA